MDRSYKNTSSVKALISKQIINRSLLYILGFLNIIFFVVLILLCIEYHYFYQQARIMVYLQNQYANYIKAVKKIVDNHSGLQSSFSANGCALDEGSFVSVNRTASYLKECAQNYFKEQAMRPSVDRMYDNSTDTMSCIDPVSDTLTRSQSLSSKKKN